mgnify:FL=1|tara:strand:- start:78 stop:458 length:381 start_codon:yes stop_codon:yes gene_type:complete
MKTLIFILCFPILGFAQTLTDTCFTKQQIHNISETLDELYYRDSVNNALIIQQESVIIKQDEVIRLDSLHLVFKQQQVELLESNIELYVKQQKKLQPKWYNHKVLWFGSGILTTILTGKFIVEVIQ